MQILENLTYGSLCPAYLLGAEEVRRDNLLSGMVGFPGDASGKEPTCQCRRHNRCGFNPWIGTSPLRSKRQPTPVFLPEEFHGQRSLAGYSPEDRKELDTTEVT